MISAPDLEEPRSIEEAIHVLAERGSDAKVIAGGTALVLMMQQGLVTPNALVRVDTCPELSGIEVSKEQLKVGATTKLSEVAASLAVRRHVPSLAEACRLVGNVGIRNAATLGGNLAEADYASDPPSVLACLDAFCTVLSVSGERQIPYDQFVLGFYENALTPTEILTSITIPLPPSDERSTYVKYVSRSSEDRPCVGVAARTRIDNGMISELNVVVGAASPTPLRVPEALEDAIGREANEETAGDVSRAYEEAIVPLEDLRGSAWYRRRMVEFHVRRALLSLWHEPT